MSISKAEIDRLGNLIRQEHFSISDDTLNKLQEHRISHQDSLSSIFTILCSYIRKIHPTSIVTYRIKRFESIIGKLNRYPKMRFSRMWDIGGCRFIVRSDIHVYKVKALIEQDNRISIVKEYDYIKEPQKNGYKALHLFIKCNSNERIIEVQIRNTKDHNWATLVEITDLLHESKIKELGDNPELVEFHYLLSKVPNLNTSEKREIAKTLKSFNYFGKLSDVFSRNYLKVRQQWFKIENQKNHRYFLIETNKDEPPRIYSFRKSKDAEIEYLKLYKNAQNTNIVLTHLPNPSYNQISMAYSNYILTFHSFLDECYDILESLIIESLKSESYFSYFKFHMLYNSLLFEHISNMMEEVTEAKKYSENTAKNIRKKHKPKEKEWIQDIEKQVNKSNERLTRLAKKFKLNMPQNSFSKYIFKQITFVITSKLRLKIQKIMRTK
ncbi:nucleotidyltransferase family protein [Reichenbachiella versicolor]|uniref:hypothetical protein n=1 Tax=Reichenbachiella versicolor TaxID=1821036 RepID=UPI000D6E5690|nr:hypothetical protein [Reichenbachiella versicolor]